MNAAPSPEEVEYLRIAAGLLARSGQVEVESPALHRQLHKLAVAVGVASHGLAEDIEKAIGAIRPSKTLPGRVLDIRVEPEIPGGGGTYGFAVIDFLASIGGRNARPREKHGTDTFYIDTRDPAGNPIPEGLALVERAKSLKDQSVRVLAEGAPIKDQPGKHRWHVLEITPTSDQSAQPACEPDDEAAAASPAWTALLEKVDPLGLSEQDVLTVAEELASRNGNRVNISTIPEASCARLLAELVERYGEAA